MPSKATHTVAPYLLLAELRAALFGGSAVWAEERITLEVIGAVRMAGAGEIRRDGAAPCQSEAGRAREAAAERVDVGMSSHRD